jgi:large subunit ribosomal protein L4
MSSLKVFDMKGAAVGEVDIADALLVRNKGDEAVRESVHAYRAAQRAGTASTLSKGEVAGSNKKPWRQKGTGRARAGYRQSPIWRGGAVAFGPRPRSYAVKVNRKVARLAFNRAFTDRLEAGNVKVIDTLSVPEIRTKHIVEMLKALELNKRVLIVTEGLDRDFAVSARNVPGVEIISATWLHPYHLLKGGAMIVSKAAIGVIEKRLRGQGEKSE